MEISAVSKFLTLNLEILEHLSSSVEIVSHQPSPFANLKSLEIYPSLVEKWQLSPKMVNVSTEVKNYLLDGSPGATFTMVSREDIVADRNATHAKERMARLQVRLEQVKADMETNRAHTVQENVQFESDNAKTDEEENALDENELEIEGNIEHIISCWESLGEQIKQGKEKIGGIIFELRGIKNLMIELPASNRAEMQPYFSSLCAQADVVIIVFLANCPAASFLCYHNAIVNHLPMQLGIYIAAKMGYLFLKTAFVLLHTIPVLYQKYKDQIDALAEKATIQIEKQYSLFDAKLLTPQLHKSAGGLPSLKLSLHSCSLPGSTNAMGIETSIALVLPTREHECDTSFVLGRPPALS
ncbi:F-box domain containing protein [Tanacetum coccineum]